MATLLFSAVGAAVGSGFGGTVLGLSGAVIGRAVGATIGRSIDQRVLGGGAEAVEVGRIDRLRLTGASEGAPVAQVWGRMRVGGQVIWATQFKENVTRRRSGKGTPQPKVTEFSYSISLAIALCAGEIRKIGRIWADGNEIPEQSLNLQIYKGSEDQLPDPRIEAVEGAGLAPAFRGIAYVVIEDLDLTPYGNRVPQFSFEVVRPAQGDAVADGGDPAALISGVAMIPGTGEYALATTPVQYKLGLARYTTVNENTPSGKTDFSTSLEQLEEELPNVGSVSLVVSWFGSDLRCGSCQVMPKVEQTVLDGTTMPWRAGGIARAGAQTVPQVEGRVVYGGTPADASVIEAISAIRAAGREVMFYPFILMDQLEGNVLPNPWTGALGQQPLPWRGRITTSLAPGLAGTPDRTAAAAAEVANFFGTAQPSDFSVNGQIISYSGPPEWSFRRFVLHYAKLCAVAGGVDAFCIGSEMRALTTIRGLGDTFPAVVALVALAADVRSILGPACKISYAADWSEFANYQADGNLYFHLDPLWASPDIDFVGIDNYLPISDWRDEASNADASWGSVYNLDYLQSNIEGGEYFDWYYDSPEGEAAQRREPILDGAHDEPWVFRTKDLKGWWSNPHHDRVSGSRQTNSTGWVPKSKPIRFTEFGCAAIDKGTNQPNRFLDARSSESGLPRGSNGRRDDLIQLQYLRAVSLYWQSPEKNPVSHLYNGPMVDMDHAHVWAWDARPFPAFPGRAELWGDAPAYSRGHWLNGRATSQLLSAVLQEICASSAGEVANVDRAYGVVRGYSVDQIQTGRASLQPLLLAYATEAVERDGSLTFFNRDGLADQVLDEGLLAVNEETQGYVEVSRLAEPETGAIIRLSYVDVQADFEARSAEARFPDEDQRIVSATELSLGLTSAEARSIAFRWLAESRIGRDMIRFALPPSRRTLAVGDAVAIAGGTWRIDRLETGEYSLAEATRVESGCYLPPGPETETISLREFEAPTPTYPVFLDLPLLTGSEVPHAPHVAVTASPWPGTVGVWSSPSEDGFELNKIIVAPAVIGTTESVLPRAQAGVWDRGGPLRVKIESGELSSTDAIGVLNGANAMAIGDGTAANWEVFQFVEAVLVAPNTYELSLRLRGQLGTDGIAPTEWPIGSYVVLLDRTVQQIDLAASARGLSRHYRVGVTSRGYDDPTVVSLQEAFDGIGLRPYPVCHLKVAGTAGADVSLQWTRRTRIEGDPWQQVEVPLGEDAEAYLIRVMQGASIFAEYQESATEFQYPVAAQTADGITGPFTLAVAQLSARFGAGPFRTVSV